MRGRSAPFGLMFANLVVGLAVLAPAGMLQRLAADLAVSIREAGFLVAAGAVVLCVGSPLMAWLTAARDRRLVLVGSLVLLALCHAASALAPDYASLMVLRLITVAAAAVVTPLAASTVADLVSEAERASKIAFVFLGWSLALACGLPVIAFLADGFGWRTAYGAIAAAAALNVLFLATALPKELRGTPMSLASWGAIVRNVQILMLLSTTMFWTAGFYVIFPYLGPLTHRLAGAGTEVAAALFAVIGVMGFVGNVIATRAAGTLGSYRTALVATASMALGALVWAAGSAALAGLVGAAVLLGLGFAATNSMVQARLVAAAPGAGSAAVALNTSWLYVGQAVGTWIGGVLIEADRTTAMNLAMLAFMLAAFAGAALARGASR